MAVLIFVKVLMIYRIRIKYIRIVNINLSSIKMDLQKSAGPTSFIIQLLLKLDKT